MTDTTTGNMAGGKNLPEAQKTSRQYKDTLFRTLFNDEKRFLELYNAISGLSLPEDTSVEPCPANPLLSLYNDLAFFVDGGLVVMVEHQAGKNPNMPLRFLHYFSDLLRTYVLDKESLYTPKLVKLPTPEFYVLYNGKEKLTDTVLRLSDAFEKRGSAYSLELTAKVIDINYGGEKEILKRSDALGGYAYLIAEIGNRLNLGMPRDEAIREAVTECIARGILAEYLRDNLEGVIHMLSFEYDREAERRAWEMYGGEKAMEEGIEKGIVVGIEKGIVVGIEKGRQEGMEEGIEKGIEKGRQEMIAMMLSAGKTLDEIASFINLPKSKLQELMN